MLSYYYYYQDRYVTQSGKGLTVPKKNRARLSIRSGRQKRQNQQADIVRTIYGHWAPESPYWLMSWEDAAVVSRYRSSVCSSSSPPPRRPPFYCYCIIASVTRYGRPWIIAFCAFAARVPLYCSLNYRSLIFVVHCSPLRDTHPRRSRWTNSTEFCPLCLYRFRNRYNFSAVVC